MIQTVVKRDGRIVGFNEDKIAAAIRKAKRRGRFFLFKFAERAQNFKPRSAALFGMKLRAVNVAALNRGGQADTAVFCRGSYGIAAVFGVVRVHEIHILPARKVLKERRRPRKIQAVPAHMRHFEPFFKVGRYRRNVAAYKAQPPVFAVFEAAVEQQLHTEAYAEHGLAGLHLALYFGHEAA